MKISSFVILAAAFVLCGCSVFRRSPTWDSVVASRSQYSDSGDVKDNYLNHLHQVLQRAGVEHKLVTYQFSFHNQYREEGVQTATAILYRDETTSREPWWVMDEYHHVPVWLPNWELDAQLEFFAQRRVDVISVKEFTGAATPEPRVAKTGRSSTPAFAHTAKERKFRALFTAEATQPKATKRAKAPAAPANVVLNRPTLAGDPSDPRAVALFRTTHGTQFDPGSSVDRAKMNELRRQLLNRTQRVSLRTE